jgi:hypothetical protein
MSGNARAAFTICDPTKDYGTCTDFSKLLILIFNFLIPTGIAAGLFFIIKAGYTLMTSEGNPQKTTEGKEDLTAAVVGTLFIALSLVTLRIIISVVLGEKPF